ncbi:MAG: hypothetical protein LH628_15370, partial [Microcoleus sp. CAN_BIN18]|nr:hypothetical protein [Microcoleus sp. CAN_BIN18]
MVRSNAKFGDRLFHIMCDRRSQQKRFVVWTFVRGLFWGEIANNGPIFYILKGRARYQSVEAARAKR